MLACRIHAKDDLRVEAQDMPAVGAGEVLLKLGAGGICGALQDAGSGPRLPAGDLVAA